MIEKDWKVFPFWQEKQKVDLKFSVFISTEKGVRWITILIIRVAPDYYRFIRKRTYSTTTKLKELQKKKKGLLSSYSLSPLNYHGIWTTFLFHERRSPLTRAPFHRSVRHDYLVQPDLYLNGEFFSLCYLFYFVWIDCHLDKISP